MKKLLVALSLLCAVSLHTSAQIKTDHRIYQSAVKNQEGRGTCTAFSLCAVLETLPGFPSDISEQHIYATAKLFNFNKMPNYDEGAMLSFYRDEIVKRGFYPEEFYPYNPKSPAWDETATNSQKLSEDLAGMKIYDMFTFESGPYRVEANSFYYAADDAARNIDAIKRLLDMGTKAIAVGYTVNGAYWSAHKGQQFNKMKPEDLIQVKNGNSVYDYAEAVKIFGNPAEKYHKGELNLILKNPNIKMNEGHAVAIVGYDETGFLIKNSWGESWGDKGYGWVSFDYHRLFADEILSMNSILFNKANIAKPEGSIDVKKLYLKSLPYEDPISGEKGIQISVVYHGAKEMPNLKMFEVKAFDQDNRPIGEWTQFFCNSGTKSKGYALPILKSKSGYFPSARKLLIKFIPETGAAFNLSYYNISHHNKEYAPQDIVRNLLIED